MKISSVFGMCDSLCSAGTVVVLCKSGLGSSFVNPLPI